MRQEDFINIILETIAKDAGELRKVLKFEPKPNDQHAAKSQTVIEIGPELVNVLNRFLDCFRPRTRLDAELDEFLRRECVDYLKKLRQAVKETETPEA